jgi:hypothetical protein
MELQALSQLKKRHFVVGCGSIRSQGDAQSLLLGLEEYGYTGKIGQLSRLPKHPDPEFLFRQVLRFVAKLFTKDLGEAKNLLDKWRVHVLH